MSGVRFCVTLWLAAIAGCAAREEETQIVIPLSGIGALVTFNGQTATFGFDTGAGAHTFARWFVDAAALPIDSSVVGLAARDATGTSVELMVVHGLVGRLEDGKTLPVGTAVVADFPPGFESGRIGGLLNPQLLATGADVAVLDLRVPELRIEPFDQAVSRLNARVLDEDEFEVCVSSEVTIPNLSFALAVDVAGGEGWLQLDTGADVTTISNPDLVRGVALESGGQAMGVAGEAQGYELARDVVLSFAGHTIATDARVVASTSEGCGKDGRLGLDAIDRCALLLSADAMAIACSPQEAK